MNIELDAPDEATENRVRAALVELASYSKPPRRRRLGADRNDPDVGVESGAYLAAQSPTGSAADAFGKDLSARRSDFEITDRAERSRRAFAAAAAMVVLVGGVIGIAWRQRSQSAAQVATAPSASPTADPPSVSSDAATSSSLVGGTPAGSSVPNSSLAPESMTAGSLTPSSSTVSASLPDPNGGATAEPGATPTRTITVGATGDDVLALQNRLSELGFVVATPDGDYGRQMVNGVWAFQTLVLGTPLDAVTDEVTPELWSAIHAPVAITPRRPNAATARHIEIYLPEQVLVVFDGATPLLITHVSTGELDDAGNPEEYCERIERSVDSQGVPLDTVVPGEVCGVAKTPGGVFQIHRMEPGYHESPLSGMWDPAYFNYGVAIHGAVSVPLYPSSHGSVKVERDAMRAIQDLVAVGDEVAVWNGSQEPDQVSPEDAMPPWDRFTPDDPNDVAGPPPGATVIR